MLLNVLGTVLVPLDGSRIADEDTPVCAIATAEFIGWLQGTHALGIGDRVLVDAETWIQAYRQDVAPPMLAEYSHERALYWLPLELFEVTGDKVVNRGEHEQATA